MSAAVLGQLIAAGFGLAVLAVLAIGNALSGGLRPPKNNEPS
jgi:hypothetical protein